MPRPLFVALCFVAVVIAAVAIVMCTASGAVPTHPTTTIYSPAHPTPTTVYVEDPARHDDSTFNKTKIPPVQLDPAIHAELPTTGTLPHTC